MILLLWLDILPVKNLESKVVTVFAMVIGLLYCGLNTCGLPFPFQIDAEIIIMLRVALTSLPNFTATLAKQYNKTLEAACF